MFVKILFNTCMPIGNVPPLSIGRIHFEFKGCWVAINNSIPISKYVYILKATIAEQGKTSRSAASVIWLCTVCWYHLGLDEF